MFRNKKRKIILLAIMITMIVMSVGCGEKTENSTPDKGTIVVGTSGEFYPLNFTKNDKLQGFEIDVWDEIGNRTDYNIEYKTAKFAGLFGMLDAGQIDTICHQVAVNDERKENYSFTDVYLNSNYQLVTIKDSGLNELSDFKDKKIGVVAGGLGDKMLQKVNEENNLNIDIQGYEGTSAMDMDLEMGRIDARLGPAIQTRATIKEQDLNFLVTDVVIFTETAAFPFRKEEKSESLIKDVNEALDSMREDGTLSELSLKWFDVDATK